MASCESQRAETMSSSSSGGVKSAALLREWGGGSAHPPRTGRHYRGCRTPRIPCWRRRARCIVPGAACVGRAEGLAAGAVAFCDSRGPTPDDLTAGNHIRDSAPPSTKDLAYAPRLFVLSTRTWTLFHQCTPAIGRRRIIIRLRSRTAQRSTIEHDPVTPDPKHPNPPRCLARSFCVMSRSLVSPISLDPAPQKRRNQ